MTTTTAAPATSRARRTLAIASLGFFLITLDILIVNVALTRIGRELGGDTSGLQWVIDAYTLLFASLLLFAGNLSDRIGAKRSFAVGIAGFLVASVACSLAPTLGVLITSRALQGAAAAVMLPASMALIREAFPEPRERAHALGVWAVGGAVAGAVGPVLGGALTTIDWRLVFAINLPVCIVMLVLIRSVSPSTPRPTPFDWGGQVTALVTLGGLVFGLIEGGAQGFGDPAVVASFVLAAAALVAFLLIQARVSHPMMPLPLFRPRGMRIALLVGFAFMVGNFGTVFVNSLYLQQHLGLSPLAAGLIFLPSAAFSICGNLVSGTLTNRFGVRMPVVLGLATMVVGLVFLIVAAPWGWPWSIAIGSVFTGLGGSVAMPQVTSVVLASVPPARAGTASAVFNTFRQVGGAVAIAVFGVLIAGSDFVAGMQVSFVVAGAIILTAAVAACFVPARSHSSSAAAPQG
ncbi:MFS transporter [Frondihabitans australicus]|uniref:DHA2 family methylenomycin A resistance protein-like MFS transporter n=1 Tax=Frondihabitans australicus TaxID=386892 RepID=A0A495IKH7_9MICO|nr:MFS transporter [Frondihabitans australicus]RKR75938.1 DHA2 family methylenomycin A resistance protein-like MFS transporter [Frondihabitans australicus]